MNSTETAQLTEFLLELNETSLTLLIIEHDMDMIMRMSDLVVVLSFGLKIAEGTPETIRDDRQVIEAYLGEESRGVLHGKRFTRDGQGDHSAC